MSITDNIVSFKRIKSLDFIKGICIICVVLLHSIPYKILYKFKAEFHIWHAVPILLLVSGFSIAKLYETRSLNFSEFNFRFDIIFKRIKKLLYPCIFVLILEVLLILFFSSTKFDLKYLKIFLVSGGSGPGSYFIYIASQNILLAPFLFHFISKYNSKGLGVIFLITFFFDFISVVTKMPIDIYRIITVRYLFIYSLGIWYYFNQSFLQSKLFFLLSIVGFIFLFFSKIFLFDLNPILPFWHSHTAYSSFWSLTIFVSLFSFAEKYNFILKDAISICGKNSLFIFLTQMVYFWVKPKLSFISSDFLFQQGIVLLDLFICLVIGVIFGHFFVLFYKVETN